MTVQCDGLSKWYGDVIGLNDLDVDLGSGIVGLLGPNGAGKSTLMRLIMGLQKPSSGSIQVYGDNPWDNTALLERIGYVPEGDAPWRGRTGRAVLERGARLSGVTEDGAVEQALEDVGLTDAADRRVGTYSKGMRQRLKFALALMHAPDLLILDEPFLGTDPLTRNDLIGLIRGHVQDGGDVILSTHVLSDVEALTERILVLAAGRKQAYGNVHEIRDFLRQYPRRVQLATPDPRGLGATLWTWDEVSSLETDEDGVIIQTSDVDSFQRRLQKHLIASRDPVTAIRQLDDDVQSVFQYLVVDA